MKQSANANKTIKEMQAQIKRQTLSDWIKEKNPIAMLSVRISFLFKQKLINRLKVNG